MLIAKEFRRDNQRDRKKMSGELKRGHKYVGILLLVSVGSTGCATVSTEDVLKPELHKAINLSNVQIHDLAGVWEYVEGDMAYSLHLNHKGNGTYEWKNGRFETTNFSNGIWKGSWHQQENDREGGFELRLSGDVQTAQGKWWYTRIGNDYKPLEPGGTFILRRLAKPASAQ